MGKKIIGFLLTFIICIGALPMTSLADSVKPQITSSSYENKGNNSTFSIQFKDREEITMAMLFLIGEEVKSETETSFDTALIDGKVYRLYAMQSIDLEKSKVSEGSWKVVKKKFVELGKAPAAGNQAGFVIGTACDGDAELTFSNIRWFKVPSSAKLTLKKVNIRKSAKKLTLSATLTIEGKRANKKNVAFIFNGKIYRAKTNKKGVAKITIKKSVLKKLKVGKKVTYMAYYSDVIVTKKVKVKK